jgi:hypothetical protein
LQGSRVGFDRLDARLGPSTHRPTLAAVAWMHASQTKKAGAKPHRPSSSRYFLVPVHPWSKVRSGSSRASGRNPALLSNADDHYLRRQRVPFKASAHLRAPFARNHSDGLTFPLSRASRVNRTRQGW